MITKHYVIVNSRSDGKNRYILAIHGAWFLVYGDCLEDAIDNLVDEKGDQYPGLFNDDPEIEKAYWDESHPEHAYAQDNFFPAGNAGELFTSEINVLLEQRKRRY